MTPIEKALHELKQAPRGSAEFQRQVMARLHKKPRVLWWIPALAAVAAVVWVAQPSEFTPRGSAQPDVVVELVPQAGGYAVRVKNALDHAIYVGAYLKDAAGDQHWIAPHYPIDAPPPQLIRVEPHTPLQLLDTGVVPDQPAKGPADLVGFATNAPARVEQQMPTFIFEQHVKTEVK